jgi:hypothetical protein
MLLLVSRRGGRACQSERGRQLQLLLNLWPLLLLLQQHCQQKQRLQQHEQQPLQQQHEK